LVIVYGIKKKRTAKKAGEGRGRRGITGRSIRGGELEAIGGHLLCLGTKSVTCKFLERGRQH